MAEGSTGATERPAAAGEESGATASRPAAEPGEGPPPPDGGRRARRWALAAATFVLGLFLGAIALGLLMESPPRDLVGRDGGDAAAPTGTDEGATAEIEVNEACLRVINAAQDTVEAIEDLGESAADLDLAGLNDVVRRLQPLQDRLDEDLALCRVDTTLPDDLSPSEVPADGTGTDEDVEDGTGEEESGETAGETGETAEPTG